MKLRLLVEVDLAADGVDYVREMVEREALIDVASDDAMGSITGRLVGAVPVEGEPELLPGYLDAGQTERAARHVESYRRARR